jgi:RNA-directed DNA polymerase
MARRDSRRLRVEGGAVRASLHHEAKPDAIKGLVRKRGGCAMKVVGLTLGGLCGCPRMPRHAWRDRGVVRDGRGREAAARRGAVSRGQSTGGVDGRREGPNAKPRRRTPVLVGWMDEGSQPQVGSGREGPTVKPEDPRAEQSPSPAAGDTAPHPASVSLWELFLSRENLAEALRRVEQNAGAPGIDGMSTKELRPWFHSHWPQVRSQLDAGTYRPQPVRRVMIPKPSGGLRTLGVPAAVDRLICQAIAQVLTPVFDPQFHPHSFGFRPGRSQHDAVERARQFIADDAAWCVDFDLDSFFDRVQHDALMARVARRVHDKRVLKLIRRYLEAGVMAGGLVHASEEGTPQGSPLSPLLSNVMLDDLDWELEKRGHLFVRYADDGRIYVRSERAGQRVMQSITQYIEQRLKLRVSRQKSAVAPAVEQPLLGFRFFRDKAGKVRVTVAPNALKRAEDRLRELTTRNRGVSMERRVKEINCFTVGWTAYFALADTVLPFEKLDKWLRRRLRQVRWKEWKRPQTRYRNLLALGISGRDARSWAASQKGYWRVAGSWPLQRALPNAYWHKAMGLKGFIDPYRRFREC